MKSGVSWFVGNSDFLEWLREIELRYADVFGELGAGCLQHFKHLIDCVEAFFELLADPAVDFRVKLMDYAKLKRDVSEFCRYYERFLGVPLAGRLRLEINELIEEAVWLHGRLWAIDLEGGEE